MLKYDLEDLTHNHNQSIENYGSGFQRHFIVSLINISSRYKIIEEKKKSKDFSPSMVLILFEEPEAFLHPSQQEILSRNLMNFSSQEDMQVICSTHSPHFVSRNSDDISGLVHLIRDNGIIKSYQITDSIWNSIVQSNQQLNQIANKYPQLKSALDEDDKKSEMEAIKQFLWLNSDRCGMFFANHVVLVEGPTEIALINKLIGDNKIKNSDCGLYILDCIGKFNIHRFMNLASALGINHSVIHDDDNDKDYHKDINQLIENSRNSIFTKQIRKIPKDLESFLGIPPAGKPHRKPQHVLYLYEKGKINDGKINEFCKLVDSCIL